MIYKDLLSNVTIDIGNENLLVSAPVRWGKTFLLARVSRWAVMQGYLVIFVSPNLTNLQADWFDKHESLNLTSDEKFRCELTYESQHLIADLLRRGRRWNNIYSLHKHKTRLESLESIFTEELEDGEYRKNIVFLIDEIHGAEHYNLSNDILQRMTQIGTVIGTTATPNKNLGSKWWDRTKRIPWDSDAPMPHEVSLAGNLSESMIQDLRDQKGVDDHIWEILDQQMNRPGWNHLLLNGQTVINWQRWFYRQFQARYPDAAVLHIHGRTYDLIHKGAKTPLKTIDNKKVQSVLQATDAVWDRVKESERDTLKLLTIGHTKIEEGQTHANMKGDRYLRFQIIVPSKTPPDDKYVQWVRLEPKKAQAYGDTCTMFTDALRWQESKKSIEWTQGYADAEENEETYHVPIPEPNLLRSTFLGTGRFKNEEPDFNNMIPCTELIKIKYEGAFNILSRPVGKRGNVASKMLNKARKKLYPNEEERKGKRARAAYVSEEDNLVKKWYLTTDIQRDEVLILPNNDDEDSFYVVKWLINLKDYNSTIHKKEYYGGTWWSPNIKVPS